MAEVTQQNRSGPPGGRLGEGRGASDPRVRGKTTIADGVVEKIAGMAAREVDGVHAMGAGMSRTFGAVRDRVPGGSSVTRGVKVEVGETQAAIDLDIVVEYGVSITDVANDVRENVIGAIERMAGLEVVEVNVTVDDVKLPDEGDEEEQSPERPRLQ
ncbi:Asp23/Gls24 family envelope stress response protein [Streptomyces sp. DH37]|uniref:Asp23/Gls24 family envelope stress response protein n=1 Tax=Streptomyces sp. DH37 TaxID=3040122 RepID=UPI0024437345|nr:Asp23/Gls24 family envelope stress response protein [Streptomyces sp. DH37]MDG9703626.1 Asp23/Gls24 family envelope stress response protein [Streptomyces sp. DH37]